MKTPAQVSTWPRQGAARRSRVDHVRVRGMLTSWLLPLVALATVALLTVQRVGGLSYVVHPFDEPTYEGMGAGLWHGVLPASDYSPGYDAFYALFATPHASPEAAYQGVRVCVILLLTLLTFGALRRSCGPLIATLCGLLTVTSVCAATMLTLYVAGAALLAGALWLVGPTPRRAGLALGLLALGASIRPEFAVVVPVAVVALWPIIRRRKRWYLPALAASCAVAGYMLVVPQYDRDVRHYPGGRLSYAFCQHYAWTQYDLGHRVVQGYHLRDKMDQCELVLAHDFGTAHTLPALVHANPRAFWGHLAHNLSIAPIELMAMLPLWVGVVIPGLVPVVVWLALAAVALYARYRRRASSDNKSGQRGARGPLVSSQLRIAVSALALYVPWMVIRPRFDYQIALLPVVALTLGLLVAAVVLRPSPLASGHGS